MKVLRVAVIVLILISGSSAVHADPVTIPGLTGVTFNLVDDLRTFTLTVIGGVVTDSETGIFPNAFTFAGTHWKVRVTCQLTNDPEGDRVFLFGRVFHLSQPDPPDDLGPGELFLFSARGATNIRFPNWEIDLSPVAHGLHSDRFSTGGLGMAAVQGMPSQIGGWRVEIKGTHDPRPIPEPSTLLLLVSGLVGLAGFGRRRLFGKADKH